MYLIKLYFQVIKDLINRMPKQNLLSTVDELRTKISSTSFQNLPHLTPASRDDLEQAFKVDSVRRSLFPSGVLVRDSQSFGVEERFADFNIPLILADRLAAMFATRHDVSKELTSLSFGTALESSVSRRILRFTIDYYGAADADVIKRHVFEHLLNVLPKCVRASDTAEVVCFSIFLPDYIHDVIRFDDVNESVAGALGLEKCDMTEYQCFGIINENPARKNKL